MEEKKDAATEPKNQDAPEQGECVSESGGSCGSDDKPKTGSYSILGD